MNPPGCHRLHKPIVGKTIGPHTCMHVETCFHNCPRISVPDSAFFYVGHQNKFQFLTNPPVTSTQCTYSLIYNHSVHLQMCSDLSNSSLRHIYTQTQVWSRAHSGTYIQYTQTLSVGASRTAHSGTYIQCTQTLSVGASSNSSLRHIYTHKP